MSSCPRVAYFCMEYGLDPAFPIYAGGLGILAGDHMKSVGDLSVPLIGIGLLWDEGYTRQVIGAGGALEDQYPKTPRDAVRRVDAAIEVTVRGKKVPLPGLEGRAATSTSTLYLLEPEREEDRWITQRLYGGGAEDRLAQEIVLGVGGVRLLAALGDRARRLSLQRGPRGVRRASSCCASDTFGGTTLAERLGEAAPARRVHDPHAGARGQRGPRPRR